jgi:hopanoid biosynthesis associated protein HpnK
MVLLKQAIVNADDFGLTTEINQGILRAFKEGIVTATSLSASGEAFRDAVALIKTTPSLDVGIHLTLVEERPVLPPQTIPSLVDNTGRFRKNAQVFFVDYLKGKISMQEVKMEFHAQTKKILDHGISITHIDSHQHIHILPKIADITIELAEKYGIKYIRYPKEDMEFRNMLSIRKLKRIVQQMAVTFFCLYSRNRLRNYSLDHFFGFYDGGRLDKEKLIRIFRKVNRGTNEIMCHPGLGRNANTPAGYEHWDYAWGVELNSLTDEEIKEVISRENIQLINFSRLKKGK